jgi:hypothetical protein
VSRTHVVIGFERVALGLRQRQLDLFSHCVLTSETSLRRLARQRVRKELPFAGYSVVKEPAFALPRVGVGRPASCAFMPESHGGEYRARTGDLLVANQALSQLS